MNGEKVKRMRLIDADALSEWLKDYGQKCIKGERKISLMYVWKHIQDMPTIEPERKTGKWIPQNLNKSDGMISTAVYYYPKCSVCGANANYTNFCPNCGADMRGEQP